MLRESLMFLVLVTDAGLHAGNPWTRTRRACMPFGAGFEVASVGFDPDTRFKQPSRRCALKGRMDPGSLSDHDAQVATVRRGHGPRARDGPLGHERGPWLGYRSGRSPSRSTSANLFLLRARTAIATASA